MASTPAFAPQYDEPPNAAASPAEPDAIPFAALSDELAELARGLDARFVKTGQNLSEAIDSIDAIFSGLDKLADVLSVDNAGAAVDQLRNGASQLERIPQDLAERAAELTAMAGSTRQLRGLVADMQRMLLVLGIYGMNIRIAGAGGDFRDFVDGMAKRLKVGEGELTAFAKMLVAITGSIGRVREADVQLLAAQGRTGSTLPKQLLACAGGLDDHLHQVATMANELAAMARRVEDCVGELLAAIQVADSTRQRIEHVVTTFEMMGEDARANRLPLPAAMHIAHMMAGQIDATSQAFLADAKHMKSAMARLTKVSGELGALIEQRVGSAGNSSLTDLESSITAISGMTESLRDTVTLSAEMTGQISEAVADLESRLDSMHQIVIDVKEIAINTRLLCRRHGADGLAVAVIAVEVASEAVRLRDSAAQVSETILALGQVNRDVRNKAVESTRGLLGGSLAQAQEMIHDACAQSEQVIANGTRAAGDLIRQLGQASDAVSVDMELTEALREASNQLTSLPLVPIDEASEAWLTEFLPRIWPLYTMVAEREVHERFLLPGMEVPQAHAPSTSGGDSDLLDDDGLF